MRRLSSHKMFGLTVFICVIAAIGSAHAQTETVLFSFCVQSCADGSQPTAPVLGKNGHLYGTTSAGGNDAAGTVFELTPGKTGWSESVLYSFQANGTDGISPLAGVVMDTKGNLYGTTNNGGVYLDCYEGESACGTVFELTPTETGWTETILHSFGNGTDGGLPTAGLILDTEGNLYGTTSYGGDFGFGTVFELTPTETGWTEKVLHSFQQDGEDGLYPHAGLAMDTNGNLYGTTSLGGEYFFGTVFELTPTTTGWAETILHSFSENDTNGSSPQASLVLDAEGNLYGTTENADIKSKSCSGGCGVVFELTPTKNGWTETVLHRFQDDGTDGFYPVSSLSLDGKGNVFGTTMAGGVYSNGTVFELTPTRTGWTEAILSSFQQGHSGGTFPYGGVVMDSNGNLYGTTSLGGAPCYYSGAVGCGTVFEIRHSACCAHGENNTEDDVPFPVFMVGGPFKPDVGLNGARLTLRNIAQ